MLAGDGLGDQGEFGDAEPATLAAQRLDIREASRVICGKIKAQCRQPVEPPSLGLGYDFWCERTFEEAKELPAPLVGERPFGRVGVALVLEAPWIVGIESSVRQFGARDHQQ